MSIDMSNIEKQRKKKTEKWTKYSKSWDNYKRCKTCLGVKKFLNLIWCCLPFVHNRCILSLIILRLHPSFWDSKYLLATHYFILYNTHIISYISHSFNIWVSFYITYYKSLYLCVCLSWRRKWPPTQVFLPGDSHGQRSLVGFIP